MTDSTAGGTPFPTCAHGSCEPCGAKDLIHCQVTLKDRVFFTARLLPVLTIAGISLYLVSPWALAGWLVFAIVDMVFVELWALCSHCPHYGRPGKILKCVPFKPFYKLWKYQLGPMPLLKKVFFLGGFCVIFVGPFLPMIIYGQWVLLALYTPAFLAFIVVVQLFFCPRCVNLACPLNRVKPETRARFFEANPEIKKAWDEVGGQ